MKESLRVDAYSRYIVEVFDQRALQTAPRGFQAFFGAPQARGRTEFVPDAGAIEIEVLKARKPQLAPFVARGSGASAADRARLGTLRWKTLVMGFPLLEEEATIGSDALLYRSPGEDQHDPMTREERNRALASDHAETMVHSHLAAHEYLARESILTGQMPVSSDGDGKSYDWMRDSELSLTPKALWSAESADPIRDIDELCGRVARQGFRAPDFLGLGRQAAAALFASKRVLKLADSRRIELIRASSAETAPPRHKRYLEAGWLFRGRLFLPSGRELCLYTYDAAWSSDGTTDEDYLPGETVFVAASSARHDRYYGPSDRMEDTPSDRDWYAATFGEPFLSGARQRAGGEGGGVIDLRAFHFDAYRGAGKKTVVLRTQSAPIYATTETDTIGVMRRVV